MLKITVPASESYDEINNEFISTKEQTLVLEHSLVSLKKWESKWETPFMSQDEKTNEQTIDYIRCMTLTQNVDPNVYKAITNDNIRQVSDYINKKMTATTFHEDPTQKRNHEIVTAELIYYWMIALQIPMECQKWHLNQLLTLIRVCNIKNTPPKKMGRREAMSRQRALNAARRKAHNTKG